jgi:hypothetical protein
VYERFLRKKSLPYEAEEPEMNGIINSFFVPYIFTLIPLLVLCAEDEEKF